MQVKENLQAQNYKGPDIMKEKKISSTKNEKKENDR